MCLCERLGAGEVAVVGWKCVKEVLYTEVLSVQSGRRAVLSSHTFFVVILVSTFLS